MATMLIASQATAAEIRVAVASNFTTTLGVVAEVFEANSGHTVILASGSTGKHYAQIMNGAPFDAFFAADVARPKLLEQEGLALPGSRFTYALGQLILWSPDSALVDLEGAVLEHSEFRHLAIANPKLAPYGLAAREVLQARGLWDDISRRLVRGENIGQAFQFVASGNAELGFVARSQLIRPEYHNNGSYWDVPAELYTPIEQQAILLKNNEAVRAFMSFLRSKEAIRIIRDHGYDTP